MKLTNAEITSHFRDITEIINRREKYPVRFSFVLLKNYQALEPENRNIEEARNRLLDEYNRKDSEGKPLYLTTGQIDIFPEHQKEWEKGMKELLDIEVEVPVWKVPESILEESDKKWFAYAGHFLIQNFKGGTQHETVLEHDSTCFLRSGRLAWLLPWRM